MAPVITLVAALIAAAAALAVMVIDRVWSAREQRRADRRRIYAQFLGACWEGSNIHLFLEGAPEIALRRAEAVAARFAEVELIAPREVQLAAQELASKAIEEHGSGDRIFGTLRMNFLDAARRDLGEPT